MTFKSLRPHFYSTDNGTYSASKMHWQFGGNLEPVQMICEMDWKECPNAIGNYIWSEIVTDVLDCLKNESTVWRVIAALLVCILLLRIICSKTKRSDDITIDGDIMNKVGYKVEDLELKVNILTYKLQYGCWPLPHQVQKSNFRKNIRNLRLTLSNPNDRNNWIKHVLLSPRRNESYASYTKYSPSEYRVTELFDAKKRGPIYPYLRQENLRMEHCNKSSKSSSDKSLKLSTIFKNVHESYGDVSSEENCEMRHRNAISVPLFSRKRNSKSRRKSGRHSKCTENGKAHVAYRNFTRTIDDCKRYLKQLHDSNKKLGLICSSSELSGDSSIKNILADTQRQRCIQAKYAGNINGNRKENKVNDKGREVYAAEERNLRRTSRNEQNNDYNLELSNAIYPVLKMIDKRLIPSKMNITFCTDIFPEGSALNMSIPNCCEPSKSMKPSQETLYQVKKKLESLHNVLRLYELQSREEKDKQWQNSNEINNSCQNGVNAVVPVTKEAGSSNKSRTSKLNFNDTRTIGKAIQQPTSNSSEEYESDETYRSSVVSIQNYCSMFNTCRTNYASRTNSSSGKIESQLKVSSVNDDQLELMQNNKIEYSSTVNYEKIPERIYYVFSSDSFVEKDVNKETTVLSDTYVEDNHEKSLSSSDQYPVPMETDEDVISPKSSRTEVSKDSELEDKPTAVLLQEALQFKKALLTRVELENVYYIDNQGKELNSESTSNHDNYAHVNNNLLPKLLDIISEEQSISSSTEKTSRSYMFFNLKQDTQHNHNAINYNEQNKMNKITDFNVQNRHLDSKQNLASPSEYFSICNINQEVNIDNNQLSSSKHNDIQGNESTVVIPSSLEVKYINDTLDKSCENLLFSSCMGANEPNLNEKEYILQKQSFKDHFSRMNSINEFIYRSINSVELFSQNLDESVLEDETANMSNKHDASNYVNHESLQQYANKTYSENAADMSNTKLRELCDNKYTEDHEIATGCPNLMLKRNPGACSLIQQTQNTNRGRRDDIIETDAAVYELSPCESKETSLETNLIQDSLTSSINNSNDSNIPEPPSVTLLLNKSLDEEKLDLSWLNTNDDSSDDCIGNNNRKTFSTNTITLSQTHATDVEYYEEGEDNCRANENQQDKENTSPEENSRRHLDNERLDNEVDYFKSFPNLTSPHSSIYFTDEAPSSITKLNNIYSTSPEDHAHSKLHAKNDEADKVCERDERLGDTINTEIQSISVSDATKEINTSTAASPVKDLIHEFDTKQKTSECPNNANNRTNSSLSKTCIPDPNAPPRNHRDYSKDSIESRNNNTATPRNKNNKDNLLMADNVISDRTQANLVANKAERFSTEQCIIWSNMSPRQYSPTDVKKNNASKKMNATVKSRSHENYTSKSEKLKRESTLQHVKNLKSDIINTIQGKKENHPNSIRPKQRNLSAEPRRNKENTVKLEKKRSKSQICFRTNESPKQITSQSAESPNSIISVDYTQPIESTSKLVNHLRALSITSKTSSRSCIPILKSRLEAARIFESEPRPKSPMRGPLTMTMFCSDNLCDKGQNVEDDMQVEGKSKNDNLFEDSVKDVKDPGPEKANYNHKQDLKKTSHVIQHQDDSTGTNISAQENMVIYVNIFTKYDHNTTKIVDPNKFLKYVRNRNMSTQNVQENHADGNDIKPQGALTENDKHESKIVTVVSSIINGNQLNQTTSTNLPTLKMQNDSVANVLLNGKLKNLCFLSVEHREIDVTAKPSVIDTSTSISDLNNITKQSENILNKFQICGTPKELDSEEYIALLEILHQESNVVHLQELKNVCTKLVLEHRKSK